MKKTIDFSSVPSLKKKGSNIALKNLEQMINVMKGHESALQQLGINNAWDRLGECLDKINEIIKTEKEENVHLLNTALNKIDQTIKEEKKKNEKLIQSILDRVDNNVKSITQLAEALNVQGMNAPEIKVDAKVQPDKTKKEFVVDFERDDQTLLTGKAHIKQVK